jgi:hypothetical protein
MKVGILTFHNASNYGATLQAQAIVSAYEKYNNQVYLIDYTNNKRKRIYSPFYRVLKSLKSLNLKLFIFNTLVSPGIIIRNYNFKKYQKNNLKIYKKKITNKSDLKKLSKEFDLFVVGSDQVWNPVNNGADYSYLLDLDNKIIKKVSYAPSFGVQNLPKEHEEKYKKYLNEFDLISVRDEQGVILIKNLINRQVPLLLDPVLLHDSDYWDQYSKKLKIKKKFDLLYVNDSKLIDKIPKDKNIISIGSFNFSSIKNLKFSIKNNDGPSEFITYIKDADNIYTTSYHGVIFCLIYNKPFYVFLSGKEGKDTRIKTLLNLFGLTNRMINSKDLINQNNNDKINFDKFNKTIENYRKTSYSFIKTSLNK